MLLHTSFLGWILIGLVVGILGKIIMPGRDPGGFVVAILICIVGALLAGSLSTMMSLHVEANVQRYGVATMGAVLLLVLYRLVMEWRTR